MNNNKQLAANKLLLKKYRGKPHPLVYENLYQLLVMVILSAQSTDAHINLLSKAFFKVYPDIKTLATASENDLHPLLSKVRNFGNKSKWLIALAQTIKEDQNIPLTMETLVKLPGIGRKSANVIQRGAGVKAEGIIVDLHVLRVAPRIGLSKSTDPKKMELELMSITPKKDWGEVGMALSFLGREICRPTHPMHQQCVVSKYCAYFQKLQKSKTKYKKNDR